MFLESTTPTLKICGITDRDDALALAELHIPLLGVNFWPQSKRYCSPDVARSFLSDLERTDSSPARVGVFVNNAAELAPPLIADGLLDAVQLHGDESPQDILSFLEQGIPTIRALPAPAVEDGLPSEFLSIAESFPQSFALLLDTPAGSDYGGTGKTFDWSIAAEFRENYPDIPLFLAGGLNPENADQAIQAVQPSALDIASGAESSPGKKDLEKCQKLLDIVKKTDRPFPQSS